MKVKAMVKRRAQEAAEAVMQAAERDERVLRMHRARVPQAEIARREGVSRQRIGQILARALRGEAS